MRRACGAASRCSSFVAAPRAASELPHQFSALRDDPNNVRLGQDVRDLGSLIGASITKHNGSFTLETVQTLRKLAAGSWLVSVACPVAPCTALYAAQRQHDRMVLGEEAPPRLFWHLKGAYSLCEGDPSWEAAKHLLASPIAFVERLKAMR